MSYEEQDNKVRVGVVMTIWFIASVVGSWKIVEDSFNTAGILGTGVLFGVMMILTYVLPIMVVAKNKEVKAKDTK